METAIASYTNSRTGYTLPKDLVFGSLSIHKKYNFTPKGPSEEECFGYYRANKVEGEEKIKELLKDAKIFFKSISQVNIYPWRIESYQYAKLIIEAIGTGVTERDCLCIAIIGETGKSMDSLQESFAKEIEELKEMTSLD
jgi:hypothetical protein